MPETAFQTGERTESESDSGDFLVEPEAWETAMVFLNCQDQWRKLIPPMGGSIHWEGLRFTEVESAVRMMRLTRQQSVIFPEILMMQDEAKAILNSA